MPPDEVLTELGRVTFAAIILEDFTAGMCDAVRHTNPRADRRFIGRKIKDALKDLSQWPESPYRVRVETWLATADLAIQERNAAFHAVPLTVWQTPGLPPPLPFTHSLGEVRNRSEYSERPLTVEALTPLREQLEAAAQGWRDVFLLASSLNEAHAATPDNG